MAKLIDGEMPNIMKNRGEEGKWKNKRKRKEGGETPYQFFQFLCFVMCPWGIRFF